MKEFTFPLLGKAWPVHVPERAEDLELFRAWVLRQRDYVACDTEGKGLKILSGDPDYVRVIQFGTATEAWNICTELGPAFKAAARWALETLPKLVGHNWHNFDALALNAHLGLDYDMLCHKAVDTMHLAKLVDPRAKYEGGMGARLKDLSDRYIDPDASDTSGDLKSVFRSLGLTLETGWAGIDLMHPTYQSYGGGDVILTARLREALVSDLDRLGVSKVLRQYEGEVARICGRMSLRGMLLDREYTEQLSERLLAEAAEHSATAARYGVGNINATAQVISGLEGMGESFAEFSEKTGKPKVDKSVLSALADIDFQSGKRLNLRDPNPLAAAIMKARRAGKWNSAYAETFLSEADVNGRVHPSINTLAARTGRMSVRNPAVQTLPSGDWMIRRGLLAEPGHVMVSTDFQAIEMRVLAALADVRRMKEGFASGGAAFDVHMYTAKLIKGEGATKADRKIFKGGGFGKVYGGGATTIARQTGAPESIIRPALVEYDRVFPEIKRYSSRKQREARQYGMVTVSATGRRLPLDRDRTYAVVNYACQSAARDCLGQSLLHMESAGLLEYMRMPIHDEVLASVPSADAVDIAREFERCMTFELRGVPIVATAEIGGRSWGSLYMKTPEGKLIPELAIANDEFYAANPEVAHARAA